MKSMLRKANAGGLIYDALMFSCPGCASVKPEGNYGIHLLPVNSPNIGKPSWDWDGNLEAPTLSPSILTRGSVICHSFLRAGIFEFLSDCTHPLVGQHVPIPDLPQWAEELS